MAAPLFREFVVLRSTGRRGAIPMPSMNDDLTTAES